MKNSNLWKRYPKTMSFFTIILVLLLIYVLGSLYFQKDRQVDRILQAMNNPEINAAQYVSTADPDFEVTDKNVKPLQEYFANNQSAYNNLKKNIAKNKAKDQIRLVQSGSHFLFYPRYTLQVGVYHPQVQTNHPASTLAINDQSPIKMTGADQNYYADLGKVLPGRYRLVVKTKVAGRDLKADSIVNIWSSKTINMKIKTGSFQVRSVPNGVVYINDKKVKILDKYGQASFINFPLAKNMELYVQAEHDGKTIRSETVKDLSSSIVADLGVSDDVNDYDGAVNYDGNREKDVYQDVEGDYVVNPLWTGLIKEKAAGHLLYNAYLKPTKTIFTYEKDYKSIKKWLDKFRKGKKHLKLEVQVKKILPAGDYYSQVSYRLRYSWREGRKKKQKVFNYDNASFHEVQKQQLIESLGKKEE